MLPDVEGINKKALCYNGNENLKYQGVSVPLTAEHIIELQKIANDVEYFIEHYVNIVTLDDGVQAFKLHDYQKEWVKACHNNRFVMGKWSRQSGKCVSPETIIKVRNTSTGEVREIAIGDFYKELKDEESKTTA